MVFRPGLHLLPSVCHVDPKNVSLLPALENAFTVVETLREHKRKQSHGTEEEIMRLNTAQKMKMAKSKPRMRKHSG